MPSGDFEESDKHLNSEVYNWCINSKASAVISLSCITLHPGQRSYLVIHAFPTRIKTRLAAPWTGGRVELTDRIAIPWMTLKGCGLKGTYLFMPSADRSRGIVYCGLGGLAVSITHWLSPRGR